jgi:lipopolysaccharide export system permease protein
VLVSLLQRTILYELVRVFLLSLLGITGILVMAAVVAEATQQGLTPAQVLTIIPLLVPSTLPYTMPATTLFATCVVYGRLSHDNEILALKAAGVHLRKVVGPGIFLGVLMSTATMALYYHLIPYTHYLLRSSFLNDAEEYLYTLLKKDHMIKMPNLPYCIFVRQVQGRRLEEALFKRRAAKGENYDVISRSREAELHVDLPNKQVLVHMRRCHLLDENGKSTGYFQDKIFPVPLPPNFGAPKEPKPRGMTYPELFGYRQKLLQLMNQKAAEAATTVARLAMSDPPRDLPKHLEDLQSALRQHQNDLYNVATELQMRPAIAFGCLCFVLVGCPVGIWFSRSDYLSAFITCFLPIVFVYYPLLLCSTSYAKQGKIDAAVALWAGNALMGLVAGVLFRQLLKH